MDVESARYKMVHQQVRAWDVLDGAVLDVMASVPRERFVPERYRSLAFADTCIPLGHGEAMMTPPVEGRMLQALALRSRDQVLEVGTGSGFITACLGRLAAGVRSIEIHPALADQARARLAAQAVGNAQVEVGDASRLAPELPRFDAICVTGSLPQLEPSFQQHLAVGGRLFIVLGTGPAMQATLITRVGETAFATETLFETSLPALRNALPAALFVL
jgi:protein-L-isoaspartate(D-aspartate) O-methyltransferase